jgi:hypothetical protein
MAVKVTVNSVSPNRISINNQQRTTIRTVGITNQETRLSNLTDVDASDPDNNETLVYDETLQKYVIKVLPNIDGGIF